MAAIVRQVRPHWRAPNATGVSDLVTTLSFQLARDGSLVGEPRVVSQEGRESVSGYVGDLHAEYAIRAVKLAGPFNLPEDQYETWKTVSLRFDSKL